MKPAITKKVKAAKRVPLWVRLQLLSLGLLTALGASATVQAQIPVILDDIGNPEWAAECGQAGGYSSCENLADQNLKGTGIPASPHMTAYYLLQACKYGTYEMCEYAYGMAETRPESVYIRGEAAQILCLKSNHNYCVVAFSLFSNPDKPTYIPQLVSQSLEVGCAKGNALSCSRLGPWYDDYNPPQGVAPDLNKALYGYSQACLVESGSDPELDDEDLASMCYFTYKYGLDLQSGPDDQDKAEDAFIRSCQFGNAETCETVMSSFFHGINGVRQDDGKAAMASERACDLGVSSGCNFVGHSFLKDEDYATALTYYGPSCESSPDLQTCMGALTAAYYATSPKDASTTQYAELACEEGNGWACFTYGYNTFWLSSNGNLPIFQKSCDLGYQDGCAEVTRQEQQAERNVEIDAYNERVYNEQMRPPVAIAQPQTWDDLMRESQNYWNNWKPSYCSNYTRAGVTSKVECSDY
jgi:TPR repeat protein